MESNNRPTLQYQRDDACTRRIVVLERGERQLQLAHLKQDFHIEEF